MPLMLLIFAFYLLFWWVVATANDPCAQLTTLACSQAYIVQDQSQLIVLWACAALYYLIRFGWWAYRRYFAAERLSPGFPQSFEDWLVGTTTLPHGRLALIAVIMSVLTFGEIGYYHLVIYLS